MAVAEEYHPPLEEYLTTIYELAEDGITVIQARLVERLGFSAPAVWEMVGRLKAKGFLSVEGRTISLTDEGRSLAERVVRKHRLAERLLTDVIGLPWHKAHLEAGRWEHVISDEVADLLAVRLDDPATCPHGNPIPGGGRDTRSLVLLSGVAAGARIRLSRVTETVEIDATAMNYLNDQRFITGVDAMVTGKSPDGAMSVQVDNAVVALGPSLTNNLYVELLPA
jgi:DtxR family transcriptional regulator, Mn-dependent transcriptional regulator